MAALTSEEVRTYRDHGYVVPSKNDFAIGHANPAPHRAGVSS